MGTSTRSIAAERSERIEKYLHGERFNLAEFLVELAEFDRLGQYRELGYGTLWSYCEKHLRLPKGQCNRRTTAVSLIRKFPRVVEYLRDGRHCMSTVSALKDVLTPENADRLLTQSSWKTVEDVEYIAACERPKQPAPEGTIRKVPVRSPELPPAVVEPTAVEPVGATDAVLAFAEPTPQRRTELRPICEDLYIAKIPLTSDRKKKLDRVTEILGHAVPSGKPEDVLDYMLDLVLQREEKRRKGPEKPRPKTTPKTDAALNAAGNREGIPIEVQRFVFERDEGRCTFKMPSGARCNSTKHPQFHHSPAVAHGGKNIPEHLTIHCREHNQLEAVRTFGAEHMERFKKKAGSASGPTPERPP